MESPGNFGTDPSVLWSTEEPPKRISLLIQNNRLRNGPFVSVLISRLCLRKSGLPFKLV